LPYINKRAIRKFYTEQQLKIIPEDELKKIQMRAARSLKFPNGDGIPYIWEPRGRHRNGKLKARISNLEQAGILVRYNETNDTYFIRLNKDEDPITLNKKRVDELNNSYKKKLSVFK